MRRWAVVVGLFGLLCSERVACFLPATPSLRMRASQAVHAGSMLSRTQHSRNVLVGKPLKARTGAPGLLAQAGGASTSDKDGVQLPEGNVKEVSAWLSDEVRQWLDDEWIPRDIHREIGEIAAGAYESARERGINEAGDILMEVANTMMGVDLYEADVGAFDIANKVTDLLLINDGRDVCCTVQPYNAGPSSRAVASDDSVVPPEAVSWTVPDSGFDRYQFLQQTMDGRTDASVVDRAVLESLGFTVRKEQDKTVYDASSVKDDRVLGINKILGDEESCELLQEMLKEDLEEANKDEEDLEPLIEALVGEGAFRMAKDEGDVDFAMREVCVKWLHFSGGY
uniref:Uncharacterized protein n=1 Tax=Hemiselmis andersenii TaxID=464988 RepID=A0A6U2FXN0_HEMAN